MVKRNVFRLLINLKLVEIELIRFPIVNVNRLTSKCSKDKKVKK